MKGSYESHDFYGLLSNWNMTDVACERRRISLTPREPVGEDLTGKVKRTLFIMIYLKP